MRATRNTIDSHSLSDPLWEIVYRQPQIDPAALASAIEHAASETTEMDFRTTLLIRDGLQALAAYWGRARFDARFSTSSSRASIESIRTMDLGTPGFPSIEGRLMEPMRAETILEYFRELGARLSEGRRISVSVGGSAALILEGRLIRHTEDIDFVNEVPDPLRSDHELLNDLSKRYGLRLAHFQSHYLPEGWEARCHRFGTFRGLEVSLVDIYDIWLSKLFSSRTKDRDDLRVLARQLERLVITDRLRNFGAQLLGDARLRKNAEENWYIVFGDGLPQ